MTSAEVWVVKIGSALITRDGEGIDIASVDGWCRQISRLLDNGKKVALVSSGAVAEGARRLGFEKRPDSIHELQAVAAVGQMGVMQAYEESFRRTGRTTGSVLLTHDDLSDRRRYLNARTTLGTLLDYGVVPVINENDSVATEEIRFGDNDTLAARVASLVSADVLVLLTDQKGLHREDPRINPQSPLVDVISAFDESLESMAGAGPGRYGRGGMITKIQAARYAARAGCHTVIADGRAEDVVRAIASGQDVGTWLTADVAPLDARKQWIAGHINPKGEVWLDQGAVNAIRKNGVSILPVGVARVAGEFERGDVVGILAPDGVEIGRGLINYGAREAQLLAGHGTERIEEVLGYVDALELVHRDNLALLVS